MNQAQRTLLRFFVIFMGLFVCHLSPESLAPLGKAVTLSIAAEILAPPGSRELAEVLSPSDFAEESTPWGRNPFLTEEEEKERGKMPGPERMRVKAIILGPPRAVATLDGQTVLVGDMVGEEKVVIIRPDAVVLERGKQRRVLRVRESSISIQVQDGEK